jgi:hypothetical protein
MTDALGWVRQRNFADGDGITCDIQVNAFGIKWIGLFPWFLATVVPLDDVVIHTASAWLS